MKELRKQAISIELEDPKHANHELTHRDLIDCDGTGPLYGLFSFRSKNEDFLAKGSCGNLRLLETSLFIWLLVTSSMARSY